MEDIPLITDWTTTRRELAVGENRVNFDALALALRGDTPIPRQVRDYLASLFEGNRVKRPKGRPFNENLIDSEITQDFVVGKYQFWLDLIHTYGTQNHVSGTPHEIALEHTQDDLAKEGMAMSVHNIKKILQAHWPEPRRAPEDPFWEPPRPKPK
jgi:hypothetical protein